MLVIKDFATTTTASALTAAATVIAVVDGSKFPSLAVGDYFYAVIQDFYDRRAVEVVKVLGVSGNELTVERGQDGTVGRAFPAGAYVELRLTVRTFAEFIAQSSVGNLLWEVSTSSVVAQPNKGYLVNATGLTITLPASPVSGQTVGVGDYNSSNYSVTIARNGSNIMGRAEDFIFNLRNANVVFVYIDPTFGWMLSQGFGESQAPYAVFNKLYRTDVEGQQVFPFASNAANTVDVYINGTKLDPSTAYTVTTTEVLLAAPVAAASDFIEIYGWNQALVLDADGIVFDNAASGLDAGTMQQALDELAGRTGEPASIITVEAPSDIASVNKPAVTSVFVSDSLAKYAVTPTTTGKESTPDTVKMADGRFASRIGWSAPTRTGVFSTGDFGHRCGSFTYNKFSHTHAALLSDLSRFKPELNPAFAPIVRYLDPKNGVQGAGGTSWATAESRWAEVIAMNPDIVYIRGGLLNGSSRITSFTLNKNMAVVGVGELPVVVGPVQGGVWSKESGYSHLYRLAITVANTNTANIFDRAVTNLYGAPSVLSKVSSLAECEAVPGSWYQDSDFSVVAHTLDSRELTGVDGSIICTLVSGSVPVVTYSGDFCLYVENLHFWGGFGSPTTGDGALVINANGTYPHSCFYNKKCGFNGARGNTGNGLTVRDIAICISEKSESLLNKRDGFNYHWGLDPNGGGNNGGVGGSPQSPHFVEIDCFASSNGLGSSLGNNQGSTSHNECHGFRINSAYTGHLDGGNVVDVEGSRVWMVGVALRRSSIVGMRLSTTGSASVGDGEWWIDGASITENSSNPSYGGGDLSIDGDKTKVHVRDVISDKRMYVGLEVTSVDVNL